MDSPHRDRLRRTSGWMGIRLSVGVGFGLAVGLSRIPSSLAAPISSSPDICQQDFESLISQMLTEIPAYVNRVKTRANHRHSAVILASAANFDDLPLQHASFSSAPVRTAEAQEAPVRQVFFSTLLRRFSQQQIVHQQEHHWLFMAPSDRGWEFVQMYSILDRYPTGTLTVPPRDSSNGAMATAIKDWLKRCHSAH